MSETLSQAIWTWQAPSGGAQAQVIGYPPGGASQPTKTGVMPADLLAFIGVPALYYGTNNGMGSAVPVPPTTLLQYIRWAEDWVERETSLLLCQSWVAAPPLVVPGAATTQQVMPVNGSQQVLGVDYDMPDAAYDFWFPRAEDSGWMAYQLRYRPVKMVNYSQGNFSAIQKYSYVYPLLNEFFQVPPTWQVVDEDMGWVRLVPTTNIQMLPLFALYLGFLAFTDSLPGGINLQYIAGLTPADLQTRYSFIPQLVLAQAAITALSIVQGSINVGFTSFDIKLDSTEQKTTFDPKGAYYGLIQTFTKMRDTLLKTAISKVAGPALTFL